MTNKQSNKPTTQKVKANMNKNSTTAQLKISNIEITNDVISARGGLTLFLRYLENTQVFELIEHFLGEMKGSKKGITTRQFLSQIMVFIMDGSHNSINYFDQLKSDDTHAALLEMEPEQSASSHQIKRFFRRFIQTKKGTEIFRNILTELFLWRLDIEKPEYIILGIDTMVLDNDDAPGREGVEFTYKNKKGFQPLHITWGSFLADVIFRKGSAHSNHENDFIDAVSRITKIIRSRYSEDIPIILAADSGFFDQKAFDFFDDKLKINYVVTGKLFKYIMNDIKRIPKKLFSRYERNGFWKYIEVKAWYKSWNRSRRAVFTSLVDDDKGQTKLDFMRINSIIITNMGTDKKLNQQLENAGIGHYTDIEQVIRISHNRGRDELVHRSLKELATKEQLPFKRFEMNEAFYYLQAITHIMFESFKRDVSADLIPVTSYPNTFRRKLIDFAVKIVKHSALITMKVREFIMNSLKLDELWLRCQSPPQITFA
jgi:Transposase DDE domain group 1